MTIEETHDFIYEHTKDLWPEISDNRTAVLRRSISNYRAGKGMCLSKPAFDHLKTNSLYTFEQFERPRFLQSRELTLLDAKSTSPYYVDKGRVFLSDEIHCFTFAMIDTFEQFVDFLKS